MTIGVNYECVNAGKGDEDMDKRLELYKQVQEKKPRASAPKRIPLTFVKGGRFEDLLRPYLAAGLRKGVPSLFQNLRQLYSDPDKVRRSAAALIIVV